LWQEVDPDTYQDMEFDRCNQSAEEREKRWTRDRDRKRGPRPAEFPPEFPPEFPEGNGRGRDEFPHGIDAPEERQRQSQSHDTRPIQVTPRLNRGVRSEGRGVA